MQKIGYLCFLCKNIGGLKTGALGAKLGSFRCAAGQGLKPPLDFRPHVEEYFA